ncbi:hypothetical protein EWM64_g7571 [Hericium alpestre]|uniref:Integrase catalytic domain-containing protein n=1 Tax=Hericium alpestre TaxID=135208 RepID=A0A4Y9ZNT7_9AGAM|nr:hypothetical protein EWM64_g7571 [Hericium alpestre]
MSTTHPREQNCEISTCSGGVVTHALAAIAPAEANLTLSAAELHRRLGHMSIDAAKSLIRKGAIVGIDLKTLTEVMELCRACVQAKITRIPFPKERSRPRATTYGKLISSDLFGPAQVKSIAGSQYTMTLLDDATYEIMISFLRAKSEAFGKYQTYEKFIQVHRGVTVIKNFRSDRGGEYTGMEFEDHLAKQGTHHEKTVHDSSSQNGAAERFFCTSVMHTLAMLLALGLPKFLWTNAMQHAVWLWNRTRGKITGDRTPFERIFGDKPDLSNLHE